MLTLKFISWLNTTVEKKPFNVASITPNDYHSKIRSAVLDAQAYVPKKGKDHLHGSLAWWRDVLINASARVLCSTYNSVIDINARPSRYVPGRSLRAAKMTYVIGGYPADENAYHERCPVPANTIKVGKGEEIRSWGGGCLMSNSDYYYTTDELVRMFGSDGGCILTRDFATLAKDPSLWLDDERVAVSSHGVMYNLPGGVNYNHAFHLWGDEGCVCSRGTHLRYRTVRFSHGHLAISLTPCGSCMGHCLKTVSTFGQVEFGLVKKSETEYALLHRHGDEFDVSILATCSSALTNTYNEDDLRRVLVASLRTIKQASRLEDYVLAMEFYMRHLRHPARSMASAIMTSFTLCFRNSFIHYCWLKSPEFIQQTGIAIVTKLAEIETGHRLASCQWMRGREGPGDDPLPAGGESGTTSTAQDGGSPGPFERGGINQDENDKAKEKPSSLKKTRQKSPNSVQGGSGRVNGASKGARKAPKASQVQRSVQPVSAEVPEGNSGTSAGSDEELCENREDPKEIESTEFSESGADVLSEEHQSCASDYTGPFRADHDALRMGDESLPRVRQRHEPKSEGSGTENVRPGFFRVGSVEIRYDGKVNPHNPVRRSYSAVVRGDGMGVSGGRPTHSN